MFLNAALQAHYGTSLLSSHRGRALDDMAARLKDNACIGIQLYPALQFEKIPTGMQRKLGCTLN
jgi:hypothetical protein